MRHLLFFTLPLVKRFFAGSLLGTIPKARQTGPLHKKM